MLFIKNSFLSFYQRILFTHIPCFATVLLFYSNSMFTTISNSFHSIQENSGFNSICECIQLTNYVHFVSVWCWIINCWFYGETDIETESQNILLSTEILFFFLMNEWNCFYRLANVGKQWRKKGMGGHKKKCENNFILFIKWHSFIAVINQFIRFPLKILKAMLKFFKTTQLIFVSLRGIPFHNLLSANLRR